MTSETERVVSWLLQLRFSDVKYKPRYIIITKLLFVEVFLGKLFCLIVQQMLHVRWQMNPFLALTLCFQSKEPVLHLLFC
jgi:hypothetical protein